MTCAESQNWQYTLPADSLRCQPVKHCLRISGTQYPYAQFACTPLKCNAHMYAVIVAVKLVETCAQSTQAQKPSPQQNSMQSRDSRVAYSKHCLSANKLSCQVGSSTHRHVLLPYMQLLHAVDAVALQQQCNSAQITGPSKGSFLTYPGILGVQLAAVWLSWINVEACEQAQHCCEQARVVVEEHR